jgi:alanine-glyoxylate transaminase/serine-glyoxylate transaminase/serine-pyruvate transaminase
MLPPGMAFTCASEKALKASESARLPRVYWDWRKLVTGNRQTAFNGTAPVQLFYGLQEAVRMLAEEGLDQVFARHARLAEATRRAVRVWRGNDGPELYSSDPRTHSNSVTTVLMQEGHDAETPRGIALDRFNVSLGGGLDRLDKRVFRIGHMGDLNEPMLLGALAAIEMSLQLAGVPHGKGGVAAAMEYLAAESA